MRITSEQVASTAFRPIARAFSLTAGETPWAVKMTVPSLILSRPAIRSSASTSFTPCSCISSVTWVLWTSSPSMWTGPWVSSPTCLAIRIASTTPWQ